MEYKKSEDYIILRVDRGEDIVEKVKELAIKENIKLASVSGIGACDHFVVGVYSVPEQKYHKNAFDGVYEITSLAGNITLLDGEAFPHLHICCGDEHGNCFGGHLYEARVSVTGELFIRIFAGDSISRKKDPVTGMNIMDI